MTSIFTRIARREFPAHIVWENAEFLAFMAVTPISPGHLLLVPKEQVESIYDLTEDTYARFWQIVRRLEAPLRRATGAARIGLAFEGFGVAHAHVHLVPVCRRGDLDPSRATQVTLDELRPLAERISGEVASERSLASGHVTQADAA
jgi:histidine triad (HIT) family protein